MLYFPTASTYPSYRMKPTRFISHCMGCVCVCVHVYVYVCVFVRFFVCVCV